MPLTVGSTSIISDLVIIQVKFSVFSFRMFKPRTTRPVKPRTTKTVKPRMCV